MAKLNGKVKTLSAAVAVWRVAGTAVKEEALKEAEAAAEEAWQAAVEVIEEYKEVS